MAVKLVRSRDEEKRCSAREEFELMDALSHSALLRADALIEDECGVFLCLELCESGSVEDRVTKIDPFTEGCAQKLFSQFLRTGTSVRRGGTPPSGDGRSAATLQSTTDD